MNIKTNYQSTNHACTKCVFKYNEYKVQEGKKFVSEAFGTKAKCVLCNLEKNSRHKKQCTTQDFFFFSFLFFFFLIAFLISETDLPFSWPNIYNIVIYV